MLSFRFITGSESSGILEECNDEMIDDSEFPVRWAYREADCCVEDGDLVAPLPHLLTYPLYVSFGLS